MSSETLPAGTVRTARAAQVAQAERAAAQLLRASGLPQRWRGRERFVVFDSDFGCGHAFVEAWRSWRADPERCGWLSVVAVCARMPAAEELPPIQAGVDDPARCLRLAWPPATPDLHTLAFEKGRVHLLLAVGDLRVRLPALRLQADALFARASAIIADPECVERMGRKAAPGATLAIDVDGRGAGDLRDVHLVFDPGQMDRMQAALRSSGFVVRERNGIGSDRGEEGDRDGGNKGDEQAVGRVITADHAPRFKPRRLPDAAVLGRSAVVIGAGIGGAAVAQALARSGFEVTVLDRHPRAASEASGNPAGLFHAVVHAGDGRYSRLYRAAALRAHAVYAKAIDGDGVPGNAKGLLRVVPPPGDLASMQALLSRNGLPASHLQALDREAASELAGVPLAHPAWLYPGGGWVDPGAWVQQALAHPGVRFVGSTTVARVSAISGDAGEQGWQVHDGSGAILARAAVVVLAPGAAGTSLAPMAWPLLRSRGQITSWRRSRSGLTPLRMTLAGAGYALPLPDGGMVCGATNDPATGEDDFDRDPSIRAADHHHNLQRLLELCGLRPPPDAVFHERTGWRLSTADRLPIAGPVPLDAITGAVVTGAVVAGALVGRRDQCRMLRRARGLFVLTALGSRGLTWVPLLGELIAAQACGAPWPLPQDLADAIDPARWAVRAARLAQ